MSNSKRKLTYILLALFLILGAGLLWYVKKEKPKDKTALIAEEMHFAQPTDEVYKIFIAQRDGTTTILERKDDYWQVHGKYKVNPNIMSNLLETIRGVRVKFVPTKASVPHIVKNLATVGIKVELYDKNNELLKAYYVGGMTNDERGTYMILEGKENPYVTFLPQLDGGLRWRYALTGDQWRDKTIVEYNPGEIESVSVEYPKNKSQSFRIEKKGNEFDIAPFYDITNESTRPRKDGAVDSYLIGFEKIGAEGFENSNLKRDSILQQVPFGIVTIKSKNQDEKYIRFFPIEPKGENLSPEARAIERYFADVNGEDLMLVQHRLVGKLFWSYNAFFQ